MDDLSDDQMFKDGSNIIICKEHYILGTNLKSDYSIIRLQKSGCKHPEKKTLMKVSFIT